MFHNINQIVRFNQRNRDRWVSSIATRLIPGTRILDVGAGECRYRKFFTHCQYETQDFCQFKGTKEGILAGDWEYGAIDYVSDITSIPVPDGCFDVVLCTEVLEHVSEPLLALKELNRILKIKGQLFLSAPLGSGLHQQPYHYYGGFTPNFYLKLLPHLGFEIIKIEPNGGFFRHLLQEIDRAAHLIQSRYHYKWWHPLYWVMQLGFRYFIPIWFTRLDDQYCIEEFTVGYHVEAQKNKEIIEK